MLGGLKDLLKKRGLVSSRTSVSDEFEDSLAELISEHTNLQLIFLEAILKNPLLTPDQYKYQVAAFCVLFHASFEHFCEEIAQLTLNQAVMFWESRPPRLTKALVALLALTARASEIPSSRLYDSMRELAKKSKKMHLGAIYNNNGASVKDVTQLLQPIGIDITDDPNLTSSLIKLVKQRGGFAHKRVGFEHLISPSDALVITSDCIVIARDICSKAREALKAL